MKHLSFMMDATKVTSTLSKTFQTAELCITDLLSGLETTVALLEQLRQEKGPQYKKFKQGYCEETSILQEEPLSYFKVFDSTKEMPPGFKIAASTLVTLAGDFHGSDRKLHLLIGKINVTGT